jgi:hypothetical protein
MPLSTGLGTAALPSLQWSAGSGPPPGLTRIWPGDPLPESLIEAVSVRTRAENLQVSALNRALGDRTFAVVGRWIGHATGTPSGAASHMAEPPQERRR